MKTLLIVNTVAIVVVVGFAVYFFIKWLKAEKKLAADRTENQENNQKGNK